MTASSGERGKLEREVERAAVAFVDDGGGRRTVPTVRRSAAAPTSHSATSSIGSIVAESPIRWSGPPGHVLQPLEAQGQVRAAAGLEHRVDLVHDDGAHGAQHLPAPPGGEQEVERLRRGDEDVGRGPEHGRALGGGRVAGADGGGDPRGAEPHLFRQAADLAPGLRQVPVDVGAQRLERGDVEDPGLLRQRPGQALAQQQVQLYKESGEGLAGAGGGRDQGVPAGADRVPALPLGAGRLAQPLGEPAGDDGMEAGERHAEI